jgi:hypothetical protein
MIEGLIQGVKYGSAAARLSFHLRTEAVDATPTGTPTVTIYNPSGTLVLAAASLTQVGTTAVWYYDLDASAIATFPIAMNYRCKISFIETVAREDWQTIDVVKWPWNEPLVTTEEIDDYKPGWKGKKPGAWTNWVTAIERAHVAMCNELRQLRDDRGLPIYPARVFYRANIREAAIAYVYAEIARSGMAIEDRERNGYLDAAQGAIPTLLTVDRNDDNIDDGDEEEAAQARSLVH